MTVLKREETCGDSTATYGITAGVYAFRQVFKEDFATRIDELHRRCVDTFLPQSSQMEAEQKAYLDQLRQLSPEIAELQEMGQRFSRLLREKDVKEFDRWLDDVSHSRLAEMKSFANALKRDRKAVEAALSYQWSNGQTEGQVNRLKTLKRQMYGRAKFDLLKMRVLAVP